jgi:hypothetical protein
VKRGPASSPADGGGQPRETITRKLRAHRRIVVAAPDFFDGSPAEKEFARSCAEGKQAATAGKRSP